MREKKPIFRNWKHSATLNGLLFGNSLSNGIELRCKALAWPYSVLLNDIPTCGQKEPRIKLKFKCSPTQLDYYVFVFKFLYVWHLPKLWFEKLWLLGSIKVTFTRLKSNFLTLTFVIKDCVFENNNHNNNPKCCRNTRTISLATQVFKSLNRIPHFQTAPADSTVHLICLHVLPLSFSSSLYHTLSICLSHSFSLTGLVFLGHLFLASTAAALVLHPLPGRQGGM